MSESIPYPPKHPHAKAARIAFDAAQEAKDVGRMALAFNDLWRHDGAIELALDHIVIMYAEKHGGDSAPLERVATAAIKLAEQVIQQHAEERARRTP